MELLDKMTKLIINDCHTLGAPESCIKIYLERELCQNPDRGGDYMMFTYNLRGNDGYSITNWERGRCNFGFGSKNEEDFRFLFQLNVVNRFYSFNTSASTKQRTEEFMKKTKNMFGETMEYKKALAGFRRVWSDFAVEDK